MSQRLNFSFTVLKACWQPSSLRRSALIVSGAGPPAAAMVFSAAARFSADDDTITVCAPARAKSTAISRPIPRPPPVMTTTFPENSPAMTHPLPNLFFVFDDVLERADLRHRHLEHVACLQPLPLAVSLVELDRRAGADDIARLQCHESRNIRQDFGKLEDHTFGGVVLRHLAVDLAGDVQGLSKVDSGRDPRPHAAGRIPGLALGDVETAVPDPVPDRAFVGKRD